MHLKLEPKEYQTVQTFFNSAKLSLAAAKLALRSTQYTRYYQGQVGGKILGCQ